MITLTEVKNALFGYFMENTTFSLENIENLELETDNDELLKKIVEISLDDLSETKIVRKIELERDTSSEPAKYWVLEQPLHSYSQTVEISGSLANCISDAINFYCDLVENKEERANKFHITSRDIENMYLIILELIKKQRGMS